MQDKIAKKLAQMRGNAYIYRGTYYEINDGMMVDGLVILSTNKLMLRFSELEFLQEHSSFLATSKESAEIVVHQNTPLNGMAKTVKDTIMDSIKKIQNDANYIKQAEAINRSVNTLVNIAKLELQAKKMEAI